MAIAKFRRRGSCFPQKHAVGAPTCSKTDIRAHPHALATVEDQTERSTKAERSSNSDTLGCLADMSNVRSGSPKSRPDSNPSWRRSFWAPCSTKSGIPRRLKRIRQGLAVRQAFEHGRAKATGQRVLFDHQLDGLGRAQCTGEIVPQAKASAWATRPRFFRFPRRTHGPRQSGVDPATEPRHAVDRAASHPAAVTCGSSTKAAPAPTPRG